MISNIMEMLFQIGYIVYIYNYIYAGGRSSLQPRFGLQMNHVFTFMQNLFCSLAIYNFPQTSIMFQTHWRQRLEHDATFHQPPPTYHLMRSL